MGAGRPLSLRSRRAGPASRRRLPGVLGARRLRRQVIRQSEVRKFVSQDSVFRPASAGAVVCRMRSATGQRLGRAFTRSLIGIPSALYAVAAHVHCVLARSARHLCVHMFPYELEREHEGGAHMKFSTNDQKPAVRPRCRGYSRSAGLTSIEFRGERTSAPLLHTFGARALPRLCPLLHPPYILLLCSQGATMHPELLRALANARHEDLLTANAAEVNHESITMTNHRGSPVHDSGWDRCSFGQVRG